MSNIIYTVKSRDGFAIFNDVEALGKELSNTLLGNIDYLYDEQVHRWNDYGDEYNVEPLYANACMLYETLTMDKQVKEVAQAYDMTLLDLPDYTNNGYWDWDSGACSGMKDCHAQLDLLQAWRDDFVNRIKTTFPNRGYTHTDTGYRRDGSEWEYKVTVKVVDLEKEFFNAPRVIINQTTMARSEAKHWKHYNSPEGKAERKANAERQAEINMMMLENGWHNMSDDGEGNITMW